MVPLLLQVSVINQKSKISNRRNLIDSQMEKVSTFPFDKLISPLRVWARLHFHLFLQASPPPEHHWSGHDSSKRFVNDFLSRSFEILWIFLNKMPNCDKDDMNWHLFKEGTMIFSSSTFASMYIVHAIVVLVKNKNV